MVRCSPFGSERGCTGVRRGRFQKATATSARDGCYLPSIAESSGTRTECKLFALAAGPTEADAGVRTGGVSTLTRSVVVRPPLQPRRCAPRHVVLLDSRRHLR